MPHTVFLEAGKTTVRIHVRSTERLNTTDGARKRHQSLVLGMPSRKITPTPHDLLFPALPLESPTAHLPVSLLSCLAAMKSQPHLKQGWFLSRQREWPSTSATRCPTAPNHLRHSHDARQTLDLVQMRRATMPISRLVMRLVFVGVAKISLPYPGRLSSCESISGSES